MRELRYTLLTEGTSDVVLLNHITWLVRRHTRAPIRAQFAELWNFRNPPRELSQKMEMAADFYACDILFVHRDADTFPYEHRQQLIHTAQQQAQQTIPPIICIIPVRMQEAWLLFNETAIRLAAGRPSGHMPLNLPRLSTIESVPDPKRILHETLRTASGLKGRHLERFDSSAAARRLGELLDDFTPLLTHVNAFKKLERDVHDIVAQQVE